MLVCVLIVLLCLFPHVCISCAGDSTSVLKQIASGSHAFAKAFAKAERPAIIVGDVSPSSFVSSSASTSLCISPIVFIAVFVLPACNF